MNPRLRRILALLPLLSWRALSSLYAQSVSGLVQTTEGKPLSSALVAVWDSLAERARGVTSPSGRFSILMPEGAVAVTLNVRAIGYLAQSQLIDPERSVGIIVALTPYAAPLPDITAHAVHTVCPNTDEPRARALWEAMRSRYRLAPLDQGWESVMRLSRDVVPLADVGTLDEARLLPARAGVSGGLRAASESFMRDSGYAQSLDRPGGFLVAIARSNDRYANWWYPSLDRVDIEHWLRDSFGQRHALSLRANPDGTVELYFCGPRNASSTVDGVFLIASDTSLVRANWQFRTRAPDENAGGEVTFVPIPALGARGLIPVSSVAWRLVAGRKDMYVQEAATYTSWEYGASGAMTAAGDSGSVR